MCDINDCVHFFFKNGDDEAIYQPQKTQRDEDREKDQAELEQRRLERIETQRRINEEKALKPKKVVNRKKDYDVEAIKGKGWPMNFAYVQMITPNVRICFCQVSRK